MDVAKIGNQPRLSLGWRGARAFLHTWCYTSSAEPNLADPRTLDVRDSE